jgi:aryl-alcohol dehydrogenase-like predicted oxidoreductase
MVSELSLGTVELGLDYGISAAGGRLKPGEREAARLLHAALDLGLNLLDTAPAYGDAERIIGSVLKDRRAEYHIVSKVAASPGRPERVRASVEASLKALATDHIEVMLIHCGADAHPDEETAVELTKLRSSGAIGFAGASVYGEAAAVTAIESGWCDCIEIAYNLLDRRAENLILARAAERGIGVLARSVLLKGALTRRSHHLPSAFRPLTGPVEQLLVAASITVEELPELAYRYVLTTEPPHSVLVGTARISELQACVDYARKGPLTPELLARIRAIPSPDERWLNPGNWPDA